MPQKSRGGLTTLVAGVLTLVVAGLVVGGSFGAVSTFRSNVEIGGDSSVYAAETTWWGYADDGSTSPIDDQSLLSGLALVLAAALLLMGAVFAFVAARSRTSGSVSGARSLISAGVGVLAGALVLQLSSLLDQMERYNEQELQAGETLEFTAGLGVWLPLAGLLLGLVAVVLAHVGQKPIDVRVEPNTPRMGFPAPYGYRPQMPGHAPAVDRPTDVQGDDSAQTQVVSGATAAGGAPGAAAPVTPAATSAADSPAAWAAAAEPPTTPATGSPAFAAGSPAAPSPAEPPATPATDAPAERPTAPSTPATPSAPSAPSTPATPSAPSAPSASATPSTPDAPSAPATPSTPGTSSAPAAPAPVEPATPADPPAATPPPAPVNPPSAPAGEAAKPTPLSELPAAPPAPEQSTSDDK